jgi:GH15 family glucan-1,4-alpha-glucosidase
MCSFWLVEALARAGERIPKNLDQARLLFERMLGYANHLGLYSEQTGPQGEALGNFPQAFTHLALISAAFNLDPYWAVIKPLFIVMSRAFEKHSSAYDHNLITS